MDYGYKETPVFYNILLVCYHATWPMLEICVLPDHQCIPYHRHPFVFLVSDSDSFCIYFVQFQAAITSTAGRMKLIDSMEGIMKGTQQASTRFPVVSGNNVSTRLWARWDARIQQKFYQLLFKSGKTGQGLQNIKFMSPLITTFYWRDKNWRDQASLLSTKIHETKRDKEVVNRT